MSAENPVVPGRRDPDGRRRAMVASAAELVIERGAAGLTHRAVAARAGVALGSTTQYFSSLDELRECALQLLAEEIDAELARVEQHLLPLETAPERLAGLMHDFLLDQRQVRADLALMTAAMTDPTLRKLAVRWNDRLEQMLAPHVGPDCAEAVVLYVDGLTLHAGLHDQPVSADVIATTLRALLTIPVDGKASS